MQFSTSTLILFAATLALAAENKRYIITYPEGTDADVVAKAMQDARRAGAHITHEFQLIRGFSVEAPTLNAEQFVQSLRFDECQPTVEEDSIVTTQ